MTGETALALHPRRVFFGALILSVAFGAHSVVPAQSGAETRLREIGEKFFDAYQKKDLDGLMSLWSDKSPDLAATREKLQQAFARNDKIELKSLDIQKVSIESKSALMRLVVEMTAVEAGTGKPATGFGRSNRTFHFVYENEQWKVWQYASTDDDLAESLLRVDTDAERTGLLDAEKDLLTIEFVQGMIGRSRALGDRGRQQEAQVASQLALTIAERLANKTLTGKALIFIGAFYASQRNYSRALELYERSLNAFVESGDKVGTLTALSSIGLHHWSQRNYDEATRYLERGLKLAEEAAHKPAAASFLRALGLCEVGRGRYHEALAYYERSLKIAEEAKDMRQAASTLQNMGIAYDYEGNYARAVESYQKSLNMKQQLQDRAGTWGLLGNLGTIHRIQGNLPQALEYMQASLKLVEELGNDVKPAVPQLLSNIGTVYAAQKNYTQALDYQLRSLTLAEALGDKGVLSTTLGNLGILFSLQGKYSEALEYFQRSLSLYQTLGDKEAISNCLTNIAALQSSQSHYAQAAETAERAATLAGEIGRAEIVCSANTIAGSAYLATHQLARARQSFLTAIDTIEKMRGQAAFGEQEQQRSFETRLSPYYGMVDLLVEQNNATEALLYAERAKGRVLLDVLQSGRIDVTKAMTRDEQDREREIRGQVSSLNKQLLQQRQEQRVDNARLSDLETRLQKARLGYEAFQTALYAVHPELRVQRGRMQPLTMDEVSGLMPDAKTALLEFAVLEDKTILFVMTSKPATGQGKVDLKAYTLPVKQMDLVDLTQKFSLALAERRLNLQETGTRLYDLLLKPAQAQLQGINSLIIVPDGVLWRLPFQALQQANSRYAIEDYVFSYAPSLTVLREEMKQPVQLAATHGLTTLLALGNPAVGAATLEHAKTGLMDERLEPLPEAEKQVRLLGELYGPGQSRIYTGLGAQEERFKAEAGNYKIIHLATHGILNDASPMYSQLVLSTSDTASVEDGLLEAWEIMKLDLRADLVVLSACDTARGRVGAGEGIVGLSWALFVAGAPTAVVTQWKVESASSTELMLEFHKQMKHTSRGTGTLYSAAALRQAALKLLRGKPYDHPYYWAPFVVIGNGMGTRLSNAANAARN